jgi:hypothetical protein
VDADILFFADASHATKRTAAAAVAIPLWTFARRLAKARRRFPSA